MGGPREYRNGLCRDDEGANAGGETRYPAESSLANDCIDRNDSARLFLVPKICRDVGG